MFLFRNRLTLIWIIHKIDWLILTKNDTPKKKYVWNNPTDNLHSNAYLRFLAYCQVTFC